MGNDQPSLSIENLRRYAVDLNLNTDQFNNCLDSEKYGEEVDADMADGSRAGIRGTPGFLINGQLISGAQPYENFERIINELLK